MTDILIRGMEMPHSCMCCPLNYGEKRPEYGWTIVCRYSNGVVRPEMADNSGRLPTCGISELPPHGDLVDREWLKEMAYSKVEDFGGAFLDTIDIAIAPVVIPASKEETHEQSN